MGRRRQKAEIQAIISLCWPGKAPSMARPTRGPDRMRRLIVAVALLLVVIALAIPGASADPFASIEPLVTSWDGPVTLQCCDPLDPASISRVTVSIEEGDAVPFTRTSSGFVIKPRARASTIQR